MIKVLYLTEVKESELKKEEFSNAYGELTEGIGVCGSIWINIYNFIFLYRRLIYAAALVIAYKYPRFQLSFFIAFLFIPVFSSNNLLGIDVGICSFY